MNITVIIPAYNAAAFIEKAVDSALQFSEVKELLIVEDGSKDDTLAICKELEKKHPVLKVIQHPDKKNHGDSASRNLGLNFVTYEYIAFLDADDYFLPNRFDAEREIFEDPKIDGVFGATGTEFLTEEGKKQYMAKFNDDGLCTVQFHAEGRDIFHHLIAEHNTFGASFSMIALTMKKSAIENPKIRMTENIKIGMDKEFIIKLAYHKHLKTGYIDTPVSVRTAHGDNTITKIKKMQKELISVIIPCYNQGTFIKETVSSVLAQTYDAVEIVIVNDGSTDNSEVVIDEIIKENTQIRYLKIENSDVSKARNIGIKNASGKYILPLDADDLINPKYIELAIDEFKKDPELIIVTAKGKFFGKEEGDWNLEDYTMKKMLHGNVIFCPSIFKKEDWEKIGGFDETMTHLEDWDFFIRLSALNPKKIKKIDYLALLYRIKETNARNTIGFRDGTYDDTALYVYTKNKNLFFEHYGNPSLMIKEIEKLKWENEKKQRELSYLNKFFFVKMIQKFRKIKHAK